MRAVTNGGSAHRCLSTSVDSVPLTDASAAQDGSVAPASAERPLVSVVMIFKDAAQFLRQAAQSVLEQTWPALELVLVDDGGSDGSDLLADEVRAADPDRVRVISHPGRANRGTGPSRLLGIESAAGELTAFLDADDVWGPGHVAGDVDLLLRCPDADLVCGRSIVWRSWSGGQDELNPLPFAPGVVVEPPRMLRAVLRNGGLAVPTCSLLVRTRLLAAVAADVAAFHSTYEDQVINAVLHLRAAAVMSGATDAWYRQHPRSLTATAQRAGHDSYDRASPARREFLLWLASLPELAPGRADPELRMLLDAQLRAQEVPERHGARRLLHRTVGPALPADARASLRALASGPWWGRRDVAADRSRAFLSSWAEDLRGELAVVGALAADLTAGARATGRHVLPSQRERSWPATLPPLDCVVLCGPWLDVEQLASAARHLAPGGALLAVGQACVGRDRVRRALQQVVPTDCLQVEELGVRGLGRRPLMTIRALRPAGRAAVRQPAGAP